MKTVKQFAILIISNFLFFPVALSAQNNLPTYNFVGLNSNPEIQNYQPGEGDSLKVINCNKINNANMTMSGAVLELFPNGNLHLSSEVMVDLGHCTGVLNGVLCILFYNANGALLHQINQSINFNPGLSIINAVNKYDELAKNYTQIVSSKVIFSTKIDNEKCP